MVKQLVQPQWLVIPREVRNEMRKIFAIPMSGGCIVESNVVMSDGTTNKDLEAITQDKLELFTGKSGDFYELVDVTVKMIEESLKKEEEPKAVEKKELKLIRAMCGDIDLYIEEDKVCMLKDYTLSVTKKTQNDKTKKNPKE